MNPLTRHLRLLATVTAVTGALAGCSASAPPPARSPVTSAATSGNEAAGPQPIPASAALTPTRVVIPAIGADLTGLEQLTRDPATGQLNAPVDYDKAGYYVNGAVPGDPGPAVVAGHVDDMVGPKVFYRLRELTNGQKITVTRSDGTNVTFRVDSVQQYPKGAFPTDAVYGPAPGSSLRLITCGGVFDAAARSYRDNVVVYASQISNAAA